MRLIEVSAENFQRLVAVRIQPNGAVTPIVGPNGAGKTSVLDAITAAMGGLSASPSVPIRRGATQAEVVVDLGDIKVRRRWTGKGSTLEVVAPNGSKIASPQAVLDALVGRLSFDPLAFTRMKPAEQAAMLASVAGLDMVAFEAKRKAIFDERTAVNRQLKAAEAQLAGMPVVNAPAEEVSIPEVLKRLKEAEAHNAEFQTAARAVDVACRERSAQLDRIEQLKEQLEEVQNRLHLARERMDVIEETVTKAEGVAAKLKPIDTAALAAEVAQADQVNAKVRLRRSRDAKAKEVADLNKRADAFSVQLEALRANLDAAIEGAKLPVAGLALGDGEILLNGLPLSQCSGAERLRLSVALGLALNPKLKLMLIRDGSLLDANGMRLLADMAEEADAQVLIERVSDAGEVGIRIEDGEVVAEETAVAG